MLATTPTPDNHRADHDSVTEATILQSRILIVDDNAAHVHLLTRLLQDTGYMNVNPTTDPRQVRALHRANPYDLILLDLQMPGLDGFGVMAELKAELKAEPASACLPVIVLTAQPGHKLRALQAGACDFINKPFDTVEVMVRIHHMLEGRLLHKRLKALNHNLERAVQERTAALQESEARYRSLTDLAVDWYWEQNAMGQFTHASGLVMELLGHTSDTLTDSAQAQSRGAHVGGHPVDHWDRDERQKLEDNIKARRPFLDLIMHRRCADGSREQFKISGEPMFDRTCRFTGFRGLGVKVLL